MSQVLLQMQTLLGNVNGGPIACVITGHSQLIMVSACAKATADVDIMFRIKIDAAVYWQSTLYCPGGHFVAVPTFVGTLGLSPGARSIAVETDAPPGIQVIGTVQVAILEGG
jgi:hypothetical protein